jgi:hypothetical protein
MNASIFDDVTFSGTVPRKKICRRGKVGSISNLVRSRYGRDPAHSLTRNEPFQVRDSIPNLPKIGAATV